MITVNTLSGAQLRVELAQQATIWDLKTAIKRLTHINRRNQPLIVDGTVAQSRNVLGNHERIELTLQRADINENRHISTIA